MRSQSKDPYAIDSHKMQYHSERIAQWQNAKTEEQKLQVFPIYVEISPVGHCNHRCTFCAVDYIGYKTRSIPTDVLMSALSSMALKGVKSVMFAGEGEPMLHPDIGVITRTAKKVGLDVAFTTNGTALTKKFVDESLSSVSWIKVSMNGGPETYAKIHQTKEADYERVWKNLECAVMERNRGCGQTVIGIQCVILPENLSDVEQLCKRAHEAGLDYIVLKPYSQHKTSITEIYKDLSYESTQEKLEKLRSWSSPNFKVIVRTQAMEDWNAQTHHYQKCLSTPYFWAYIMATGDVYACSAYLLNPDFCYGNIHTEDFGDLWLGRKRRAHLKEMENLDISKCRVNCRMNQVNKHLWDVANPNAHANFI